MKTTILLLLATLLGGCRLYAPYTRPDLSIPLDSLYRDPSPSGDTTTLAALPWRTLLADPHLRDLITTALQNNTDLALARLQTEEAQALLSATRLAYLPTLDLAPSASITRNGATTQKTYTLAATSSWEIDLLGKTTNAKRGAAAALRQSQAYQQAVQSGLIATVAETYYTLLLLDEQLLISRQTLATWDTTLLTLHHLTLAGKSNDIALRRARASRTALQASLLTLSNDIRTTENTLCALLKTPSRPIPRGTLSTLRLPSPPSTGLPLRLLSSRPDLAAAEAALAQAFHATSAARAALYPTLTLSGTLGWTASGTPLPTPARLLASALAQLTAPLFHKATLRANLRIARARQQEALLRFEQALLDAGNEVNDALAAWQTADARIRLDEQQVADLTAAVEQTRLLTLHSSVTYLEVLTAQQSLLDARLTLARDRIDKIQSLIRLYHALGGGMESPY